MLHAISLVLIPSTEASATAPSQAQDDSGVLHAPSLVLIPSTEASATAPSHDRDDSGALYALSPILMPSTEASAAAPRASMPPVVDNAASLSTCLARSQAAAQVQPPAAGPVDPLTWGFPALGPNTSGGFTALSAEVGTAAGWPLPRQPALLWHSAAANVAAFSLHSDGSGPGVGSRTAPGTCSSASTSAERTAGPYSMRMGGSLDQRRSGHEVVVYTRSTRAIPGELDPSVRAAALPDVTAKLW